MEDGVGSIKLLVIVLVVLTQGAGAFRAWLRKQKQRKLEEEARAGIRRTTGGVYTSDEEEAEPEPELPDWDPFEERPRAPELPPIHAEAPPAPPPPVPPAPAPVPVAAPAHKPALIGSDNRSGTEAERAPLVASIAAVAVRSHRPPDPARRMGANPTSAKLVGDVPLRTAVLAKIVLDRPLSARALGGRLPRG